MIIRHSSARGGYTAMSLSGAQKHPPPLQMINHLISYKLIKSKSSQVPRRDIFAFM